jgi:hypothetical protein
MTPRPRDLIRNDVFALGAPVVRRPVRSGQPDKGTLPDPEPLAGISAAVSLRNAASGVIRDCARHAREDGQTWEEIAVVLGCERDEYGTSAGEAAFRELASDLGDGLSFMWGCPSCGRLVSDRGPDAGLHDSERGHGDGCERRAAEIAAWDAQWGDGSDDDH